VAIAGTGGLSHQVHGEACGFNNPEWDDKFMDLLEKNPEALLDYPIAKLAELGGWEGAEVVMWLMMRGALSEEVEVTHKTYFLPSMCPIATMILNDKGDVAPPAESDEALRERMEWDYKGVEKMEGTYPFTIERSVRGFRLNHFLHSLTEPDTRKKFREDEEAAMAEAGLSDEERRLVRERDWIGMIHYGVIFFMLEKLGAVTGIGNIDIYAAMKGMSVPEFQKTRNAQINYGVAGSPARAPLGRGEGEAGELERGGDHARNERVALASRQRRGGLPFVRRDDVLRRVPGDDVGAQADLALRSLVIEAQRQKQRVARVPQPDLGGIDLVPVRALVSLQQKQDRRRLRPLAFLGRRAPGLAKPAAFRVRREAQFLDDRLDRAHSSTISTPFQKAMWSRILSASGLGSG
jgi:protocatechuate 4,5-dioxygenase alpha subunit